MKPLLFSLLLTGGLLIALSVWTDSGSMVAANESCDRLADAQYTGVKSCKKCHFKQYLSWKKTAMAKSMDSLMPDKAVDAKKKNGLDPKKDYSSDPECLACHTTGYGKAGGYPAVVKDKKWSKTQEKLAKSRKGVQCESCHGPGSKANVFKKQKEDYKRADVLALGLVDPDASNCKICHNKKSPTIGKDYKFDFDSLTKDAKKIHKHVPMKFKH